MSPIKKVVALVVSIALALSVGQPAQAADAYNPDLVVGVPNTGVFLMSDEGTIFRESQLGSWGTNAKGENESWTCDAADDFDCFGKSGNAFSNALLGVCKSTSDQDCIVSLELAGVDGVYHQAKFIRNIGGVTFPAVPSINYPGASTTSLWDVPEVPSASGTTTYALNLLAYLDFNSVVKKKWSATKIGGAVFPYREIAGDYKDLIQFTSVNDRTGTRGVAGENKKVGCVWNENGFCGIGQDYAEGTRIRLTMHLSKDISGWFRGRLKDPQISVASISAKNNNVVIEALPVSVARMQLTKNVSDMTKYQLDFWKRWGGDGNGGNFMTWGDPTRVESFEYLDKLRSEMKDTASGVNTFWSFSTIWADGNSHCLQDKSRVLGIVSTNSMVYDGGTPTFSGGFLNYKVSGLHYQPDGTTPVLGTYDLVMRSDVARCLYGFSKAPLSATVSVTGGTGSKNVATTVVSEKNGWLKMAAYGFTFSKKTIKVKITKKKK